MGKFTRVGVVFGLLATRWMKVFPGREKPGVFTCAGSMYALLWIVVIGARAAFSYGTDHWFESSLATWQIHHAVTTAALTDALIFQAVAMLLTRTSLLALRSHRVSTHARIAAAQPGGV